jgi:hypothetical protein
MLFPQQELFRLFREYVGWEVFGKLITAQDELRRKYNPHTIGTRSVFLRLITAVLLPATVPTWRANRGRRFRQSKSSSADKVDELMHFTAYDPYQLSTQMSTPKLPKFSILGIFFAFL